MRHLRRIAVLCAVFVGLLLPATTAHAYNPLGKACNGAGSSSTACAPDGSNPLTGNNGVIRKASLLLAIIAGVAAVIIIIVSGLQFITSSGDAQKVASARSALIGAVVGLVIIAVAESLVLFVLNKL